MIVTTTTAGLDSLSKWNISYPNRQPLYNLDQRFPHKLRRDSINQHTQPQVEAELNSIHSWLVSNTESVPNATNHFFCWKPISSKGIVVVTPNGYRRLNFRGRKIMCHEFTWLYFHPGERSDDNDISHLCHNNWCCRPRHLHKEPRIANKARDHCLGYLVGQDEDQMMVIQVCKHNPSCHTANYFSEATDIVTLVREQ